VGFYSVEVCVLSVSTALESLYRCLDERFRLARHANFRYPFPLNDLRSACGARISRSGRSSTGSSAAAMKNWPRWGGANLASLEQAHAFAPAGA
jgi:hypothetical protein